MVGDTPIDATDSRYGTVHLYTHLGSTSLCGRLSRTPSVHTVFPNELDWDDVCGTCERAYRARVRDDNEDDET